MTESNTKKHYWLYVLKLEDGKYYVGITSKTPEVRMKEHLNGVRVAYWTAKHKPVEIIHTEDLGIVEISKAQKRENRMVRALMKQRGLNNVRGGDLTSTEEYTQRFGYIWDKGGWEIITVTVFLLVVIAYLLVDRYFLYN